MVDLVNNYESLLLNIIMVMKLISPYLI